MIGFVGSAPLLVAAGQSNSTPPPSTVLFKEFAAAHFGPNVQRVYSAGYAAVGRYAAAYVVDRGQEDVSIAGQALLASLRSRGVEKSDIEYATEKVRQFESRFRARSADGRWFVLNETDPTAGHFGAVGDATYDAVSGLYRGTDDTVALQALVDWSLFWDRKTAVIRIGGGAYRTTRPIYVGRNTDYHSVTIVGEGVPFGPGFAGTKLFADHDAGPALALSGILRGGVRDLGIFGSSGHWIDSNGLGQLGRTPSVDDVSLSTWSNPATPRQAESRYAPYAGIAIDPFRGKRPPNGYDVESDVPRWLGTADHYGQEFASTELAIERVAVRGFNTAFAVQPCASDGNGDFIRFRDCSANSCVHGWSIGNSQSRAVELHTCTANGLHTVIDTAAHGARNGCLQGRVTLLSVSNAIGIFNFSNGLATVGPAIFENLYCEAVYRLGTLGAGSTADSALAFVDCQLGFQLVGPRGIPRFLLGCEQNSGYGPGGAQGRIRFERCRFADFGPVLTLLAATRFTDALIDPIAGKPQEPWRTEALRSMAGGLITAGLTLPVADADLRYTDPTKRTIETIANSATVYSPAATRGEERIRNLDKAAFEQVQYAAPEWRFTLPATTAPIKAGDIMLDLTSGLVFFVRETASSGLSTSVVAIQQNALDRSGFTRFTSFVSTAGVVVLAY
ncbi:MAG: hypothetical protein J0I47_01455 [Sphingomonas sp.]|uniref:hypothetical protein n=1 Tax=Sphingomonas sp. TaxID=28214 RepID=UPI001AD318F4|nr:hypothetical protein [Sphingomonas sp.]MBN8806895.1 hypothetical protein [Sphingomonas sp.]